MGKVLSVFFEMKILKIECVLNDYRKQPELWKMIGMFAEQLDVQFFLR